MFHASIKKLIALALALTTLLFSGNALACTAIYVGSDLTADGSTLFARSEDLSNSYNKLFDVSPAGVHAAGEVYTGCYGFTYTFTKDSFAYTAFSDDNGAGQNGVCPDCGETHPHTPYQAAGTNEKGVTVSATETIGCSEALENVDPYVDTGIEEAEIPTVLLSEASTAKEAVELLLSIYDTAGCCGGSGVFIADDKEVWYIENASGTQYVALKLSSGMAFAQPNMSIIGLIDLDDTENVIASKDLIAVAEKAGTYAGSKEANTIDYVASYNADQATGARMVSALKYFNEAVASETPAVSDYTISNVAPDGSIAPLYTAIQLDHAYTVADIVNYYHIDGIGSARNLETHIFQITPGDSATDTVEWIAMDDAALSVFVPYYPMLTTAAYAGYKVSTASSEFTLEQPADVISYPTSQNKRNENGERVKVDGFRQLPGNWAESCYWTMDALSNLYLAAGLSDAQKAEINNALSVLQAQCYDGFAQMKVDVAAAATAQDASKIATEGSAAMAQAVHHAAVELVNKIK